MSSVADKLGFGPTRTTVLLPSGSIIIKVKPPAMIGDLPEQSVQLTEDQYIRYKQWVSGMLMIHEALPDLSPSQREKLMTGLADEEFHEIARSFDRDYEEPEDDHDH